MPRKTRTREARYSAVLRRGKERGDLVDLLVRIGQPEARHHEVPELARIRDVAREEIHALPARANRRKVWSAQVAGADAEVRMARGTAGLGEQLGAGVGLRSL